MPDQVGVPDPHPKRKPTATPNSTPYGDVSSQELQLFDYPHSASKSSRLLAAYDYSSVLQDKLKLRYSASSYSSGYSESSSGSSSSSSPPNPSPIHLATSAASNLYEDKPLSLVIRKNTHNVEDSNANVPEYTIHKKFSPVLFAPSECNNNNNNNDNSINYTYKDRHYDSGNEDLEPPLFISEEEEEVTTDHHDDGVQDIAQDYSLKSREPSRHESTEDTLLQGIKIKEFAKYAETEAESNYSYSSSSPNETDNNNAVNVTDAIIDADKDSWTTSTFEGKSLSGSDVLLRRLSKSSNGESTYQCDFCEKLFTNRSHFKSHIVTHTGERAFLCKICNKAFGRKSTLRAHMTTHTKVSNFMCTVCDKACNDNNSLEEHMRMHTGEKPFVCTICEKAYARKSHLNVHYRVHTGERPFICYNCDKDFTEKRFLNDHLQTAHNGAEGPLKCPNCSREFAYKTSLKQHLKKQMCEKNINRSAGNSITGSASIKQFQCPFCEKSYSWKQTLKQHVSMYHRNKLHTDDFWRYELTRNRRSFVDDQVNEDLWKKQLGKHGGEDAPSEAHLPAPQHQAKVEEVSLAQTKEDQLRWFEQIKQSNLNEMTPEMKLLALQSLQKSLQFMSMTSGLGKLSKVSSPERKSEQPTLGKKDDSSKRTSPPATVGANIETFHEPLDKNGGVPKRPASEIYNWKKSITMSSMSYNNNNHQSPERRTKDWLHEIQANYKETNVTAPQLPPVDEVNHDQLWEQQIARARVNPIKSPLEPEEITLVDTHPPTSVILNNCQTKPKVAVTLSGCLPNDLTDIGYAIAAPPPPPEDRAATGGNLAEETSMLKTLLLDKSSRKRSCSGENKDVIKTNSRPLKSAKKTPTSGETSEHAQPAPPQEILRKRLLGWDASNSSNHNTPADLSTAVRPMANAVKINDTLSPAAQEKCRSQNLRRSNPNMDLFQHSNEQIQDLRANKKEPLNTTETLLYKQSVQKHLLLRYNTDKH